MSTPDYEVTNKYQVEAGHREDQASVDFEKSVHEIQIEHVPEGTASPTKALFMLLKAFVGTGVIFLPGSFKNGGLGLSIGLMVILAIICLYAFQLLVWVHARIGGSYGDMAGKLYGRVCRYFVQFFLVISQMGFVASYLMFVSQNINLIAEALSNCDPPFESKYWIWIAVAFVIPICWVRKLARLSWCAIIADVFILFGIICCLYYTGSHIQENGVGPNIASVNQRDFGLMIGTAVFSFEGIGMVVSIIESMKKPEKFPMVLNIGMLIITTIFILIGAIGYIAYGENIEASIVANFRTEALSVTVQLLYSIAMILTSPFMLWPPLTIIERGIFGSKRSGRVALKWKLSKNLVRSIIPCVSAAVSFGVGADNLDKFVSLVGIVACMPLCFIFPGLFHFKLCKNIYLRLLNVLLMCWGAGIIVYTLYVNISSWIDPSPSAAHVCSPMNY
ncbi:transmembrane amino acid transporter protein-domain-containing protein [Zychaea mexicana]|uniref:transmembrane amino acid transporter protein-domain-containing protein n=1 Tax=Zychaea mexicana TaxID=64656 RepID=UPI0022FE25E0|nr:transmembrane amino acid transporter protein-domain-containing protein [Zychaea mexicana]KAI9497885.1 transmembrane amino acid transporter protein-domain-containing protein [Zychaea mexicana]